MTELKTLKDINGEGYGSVKRCSHQELKAEAVEWVKLCEQEKLRAFNSCDEQCINSQIAWIKHFFNLTEEDLK